MRVRLTAVVCALLGAAGSVARAAPLVYRFEGTIYQRYESSAGDLEATLAETGHSLADSALGAPVAYEIVVDFAASGYYTRADGTTILFGDSTSTDTFYAHYLSGGLLAQVDGGFHDEWWNSIERNLGEDYQFSSTVPKAGDLTLRSDDDRFEIYAPSRVATWAVGTQVTGSEDAFTSQAGEASLLTQLTLTSIRALPEPIGVPLLALGLLALLCRRAG